MGKFKSGTKIRLIRSPVEGYRDIGELFIAADDYKGTRNGQSADGKSLQAYIGRDGKVTHCPSMYFEEVVPELKLEVGKFYKAANGTKVGPMEVWEHFTENATGLPLYHTGEGNDHYWCEDGKNGEPSTGRKPEFNLISEWSDEVTFKVGDKVRRIKGSSLNRLGNKHVGGYEGVIAAFGNEGYGETIIFEDGSEGFSNRYQLVKSAPTVNGPITTQTITRNSVVPGVYGRLGIVTVGPEIELKFANRNGEYVHGSISSFTLDELTELHTNIGLIINAMRNPEVVS